MSIETEVLGRCDSKCELCGSENGIEVVAVSGALDEKADNMACLCAVCNEQIEHPERVELNHWRCLNDSMWSQVPAVQVLAWRMLNRLRAEGWPQDLLDMLYLEDDTLAWAQAGEDDDQAGDDIRHLDSNGALLEAGDSVTLIKDLNVKGGGFTAKRGTVVRNIGLDPNNAEHIEGRVSGQRIVILTKFVKKA